MHEEWRPVLGYEGYYEVSNLGSVRGLRHKYGERSEPRPLSPTIDNRGYARVRLQAASDRKRHWRVHQLVAGAFIGPCPPGLEVRHLNGIKANNQPFNLAYGTASQNQLDKVAHGAHNMAKKTHCKRGHEFTEITTLRVRLRTGSLARQCRKCNRDRMRAYRAGQLWFPERVAK